MVVNAIRPTLVMTCPSLFKPLNFHTIRSLNPAYGNLLGTSQPSWSPSKNETRKGMKIESLKKSLKSIAAVLAGLSEDLQSLRATCEGVQYRFFREKPANGAAWLTSPAGYF